MSLCQKARTAHIGMAQTDIVPQEGKDIFGWAACETHKFDGIDIHEVLNVEGPNHIRTLERLS